MPISKKIQITAVFADAENKIPSFTYTNGLYQLDMPEIITFGLPPESAQYAIDRTVLYIEKSKKIPYFGLPITGILPEFDLTFLHCDPDSVKPYMLGCSHIYEQDCRIVQLCWPDANNIFAWEDGFDEKFRDQQMIIGRFD